MSNDPRIVIAGAGNIGGFVGGMLARAGAQVEMLARVRIVEEWSAGGLRLTDSRGLDAVIAAEKLGVTSDPSCLSRADLVLVTVKSGATAEMGAMIAALAPPGAVVASLQNGVANPAILRQALPGRTILAGMVPYNVAKLGPGHLHRGTGGAIAVEPGFPALAAALTGAGLDCVEEPDITAVQWGKLVINLNNAVNALSELPLRSQLLSRPWRRILAGQIDEAIAVLDAAGIPVRSPLPLPLRLFPAILRLPTPLFRLAAARSLRIDSKARSSMAEDLQAGRKTEIDALQGEIVRLGEKTGIATPECRRMRDEVLSRTPTH